MLQLLDLRHLGRPKVIASYLLEGPEPTLVDCGPSTCVEALEAGLREHGLALEDLRHLLITHIHLDHAGAAGTLVRRNPALRVHVSAIGAPHLVDPSRLERSARRLYGASFDGLWGELAPVPEANVRIVGDNVLGLEAFPTPGHASHHVCYLDRDGTLYAGDACGVRIAPNPVVLPPTPPPDLDVDAWERTIDEIERRQPQRLVLVHFGAFGDVVGHLRVLRTRLLEWRDIVAGGASEDEFADKVRGAVAAHADDFGVYERAMPLWQSYAGLKRYVERLTPSPSRATDAA